MGGGIDAVDTSPTSLIVILWMKLCTDHYCPSNRTEHMGGRVLKCDVADTRLAQSRDEFELN
jgi:hypothetical protein